MAGGEAACNAGRFVPLLFVALVGFLATAAPAAAQSGNPCDHVLPTGEALPRQDHVRGSMMIYDVPTSRGHRVGSTHSGDLVDITRECGRMRLIRTPDGLEGWIATRYLPREEALEHQAASRVPATDEECEQRFAQAIAADNCKQALARRKAREDELAHSTALTGEQLRDFVTGKTVGVAGRPTATGQPSKEVPVHAFHQANGEVFIVASAENRPIWRGRWQIEGDKLCLPETMVRCNTARRIPTGEMVFTAADRTEFIATPQDGDPLGIVPAVTKMFPYAKPPPVPAGLEGIAHPSMGW